MLQETSNNLVNIIADFLLFSHRNFLQAKTNSNLFYVENTDPFFFIFMKEKNTQLSRKNF